MRPAAALMRRRCRQYLRGEWPQLLRDSPAGLTAQQRTALASEAEARRGYAVDPTLENSVRKMDAAALSLAGHTGNVSSASFSHDGEKVVSASDDETVRVWRVDR
eukprot:COSAG02_NODE_9056_length_2346_cov_6.077437_2_plen_105_part_00